MKLCDMKTSFSIAVFMLPTKKNEKKKKKEEERKMKTKTAYMEHIRHSTNNPQIDVFGMGIKVMCGNKKTIKSNNA